MNWAKLGEWRGLLGLWVTGLSGWGRAYQKEARPTTEMSIVFEELDLPLRILTEKPFSYVYLWTKEEGPRGVTFRICAIESAHA